MHIPHIPPAISWTEITSSQSKEGFAVVLYSYILLYLFEASTLPLDY